MTLLLVIVVFSGLIFIHEFGHFVAAKLMKIEVEEFGFGLPPRVVRLFHWRGTDFTLNALPIGGFVRPRGENDPNVMDGLAAASPWKRLFVLISGPLMNILTAIIVTSLIISMAGISVPGTVLIGDVMDNSPASASGLAAKDRIVAINGIETTTIEETRELILANVDQEMTLKVERDGQILEIVTVPSSARTPEQGALGVGLTYPTRNASITESIQGGFSYTSAQALTILYLPVGLIEGVIAPEQARLIGMKGIYDIFDQAVEKDTEVRIEQEVSGTPDNSSQSFYVLSMVSTLSISLGVFNLLPIPALDGGRILFLLPELLFKKRIPYKLENYVNGVAMMLLIGLMIFINAMDFINPVNIQIP